MSPTVLDGQCGLKSEITHVLATDTCSRQTAQDALGSFPALGSITVPCALGLQLSHLSAPPLVYAEASLPSCVQRGRCGRSSLVSHLLISPLSCSSSAPQHVRQPLPSPGSRWFPRVSIVEASAPVFCRRRRVAVLASALHVFSSADLTMISPCEERN